MLSTFDIDQALDGDARNEYERLLQPIWHGLVHSNASAEICSAISEFLEPGRELPDGTIDFLGITMINAADRVVVSCIRLFEKRTDSHHFAHLADWLVTHCRPEIKDQIVMGTVEALQLCASSALIEKARVTRNKLIAHLDREHVVSRSSANEISLHIGEVVELQRKTEAVFTEFNFGERYGYRPVLMDNDHVHRVLELISEHLEYFPDKTAQRIQQVTGR